MAQRVKEGLTEKEKRFCREYVANGENGTQAAISCGYSQVSARVTAHNLLTKHNIKKFIADWREKYAFKTVISVEKQIKRLEMITSVTLDQYLVFNKKGVASFKPMSEWTEAMKYAVEGYSYNSKGQLQLKLQGKNWAADMLNKHMGIYEKDNKQQSGVQILLPGREPIELTDGQNNATDEIAGG